MTTPITQAPRYATPRSPEDTRIVAGKLIMVFMAGIINIMVGIATFVVAVWVLKSWSFLILAAFLVGAGTMVSINAATERKQLNLR